MNHFTTTDFWYCYRHLPVEVQELGDKNFALLLENPHHPSVPARNVPPFDGTVMV